MSSFMYRLLSSIHGPASVEYLQDRGLVPRNRVCTCGRQMHLQETNTGVDGFRFRCCTCKTKKSLRTGTFFAKSHLALDILLEIIFNFILELPVVLTAHLLDISEPTAVQWYTNCRGICSANMSGLTIQLGGPGVVVEINETVLSELKYGSERRPETARVFGMYDRSLQKGYFQRVNDQSAATLIPIIQRSVLPGTTIYSDKSSAYQELADIGYVHQTVSQSTSTGFEAGVHTNNVKNYWFRIKRQLKIGHDSMGELKWDRLDEVQYRLWHNFSPRTAKRNIQIFMEHIKEQYPV